MINYRLCAGLISVLC